MTELLERAVETVRTLPAEAQNAVARFLLDLAGDDEAAAPLTAEEEASLDESLAQAERGEFATDEQVRAIWAKHGL
jgi:predicted transcriptional regulator